MRVNRNFKIANWQIKWLLTIVPDAVFGFVAKVSLEALQVRNGEQGCLCAP